MSISSKYDPKIVEDKWYQSWMEQGLFKSSPNPNKEPYCIVIPPPNVTGILHMGHMLNNTIQDVLIRKARMQGKEALWVPGTDHASIATEAKVVQLLKKKGIKKTDLTREEFIKYAWEWTDKYGGIILEQLKKLGASCDWDRTRFTMEEKYSESVIKVFVDLFNKGHIYRGFRMINWDPEGKTALADDEVFHKEVQSKLYYVNYKIENSSDTLTVATTRPETILGDTAICVNPDDERFKHLRSRRAIVPLVNRSIPIIEDSYVDMEFGTGCLKVTPAHDINDYELGKKHKLETIDILNDDGSLNEEAQFFVGQDRFEARKNMVKELENLGQLEKIEDYVSSLGYSERTNAVVEPRLSIQWFVSMKEITKPALENVMNDNIKLYPSKFKNTYKYWMENVRDWCISRQLWWGHQIPAYFLENGEFVVAESKEEALILAKEKSGNSNLTLHDIKQDEDVLDTWFSSDFWPISVFDGLLDPEGEDIKYYYPTNDLVTAPEILFFWVARMIIMGYEYRNEKPFTNVYLTGTVRDEIGRRMSKSLGNSPDPLDLIDKYGADGVRTGMLFSSPAGNDLLFDTKLCEQGRNFANKIWNTFRLIKGWEIDESLDTSTNQVAIDWFESNLNKTIVELDDHYSKFRISDALMTLYKLVFDDFAPWYLEMVKPGFQQSADQFTFDKSNEFLDRILKLLHPFMPFITEEIWQSSGKPRKSIMVSDYPISGEIDEAILRDAENSFELISQIRNLKNQNNISAKEEIQLYTKGSTDAFSKFTSYIKKLAFISEFGAANESMTEVISFISGGHEFMIPIEGGVDSEKEKEELLKEIEYANGFLNAVNIKLDNPRFVDKAPPKVVESERKKKSDAELKIKKLQKRLAELN